MEGAAGTVLPSPNPAEIACELGGREAAALQGLGNRVIGDLPLDGRRPHLGIVLGAAPEARRVAIVPPAAPVGGDPSTISNR